MEKENSLSGKFLVTPMNNVYYNLKERHDVVTNTMLQHPEDIECTLKSIGFILGLRYAMWLLGQVPKENPQLTEIFDDKGVYLIRK